MDQDHDRYRTFLRAYTKHEAALRAFVRRQVPSAADAEDVMQELAIILWEKFAEFRAEGEFKAWATGIARFKVLAWLRDKGRSRLVLDSDVVELIAVESQQQETLLQRQRDALNQCLDKVPLDGSALLSKAYQSGARIQDVAATSGRSVRGFYQWLYRMRQKLTDCVQREIGRESMS